MSELERDDACTDLPVLRYTLGASEARSDAVAVEVPVALEYNGIAHAVMLASPADLHDFALGFSLSEGILEHRSELYDCERIDERRGIRLVLSISAERFAGLKERRRNLSGRTGCGLCGTESLEHATRPPARVDSKARFNAEQLHDGFAQMEQQQALQKKTGATHAAAWLDANGAVALVREDVGRHNALDKLLGALAAQAADFSGGAVLITSRASYEMVQKAATLGVGMLAAVSAPTALAVGVAEQSELTLIGFVRAGSHVVYAHGWRLL